MRALVIDDEAPARDELAFLLGELDEISSVATADSAAEALRALHDQDVDVVFSDIRMPGLTGLDLVGVLNKFQSPPPVVFVTAHDEHAVQAFEHGVADYVLKPVRSERLAQAVRRVVGQAPASAPAEEEIPVELGGVTRFVRRSDVRYVEAQGDYARLYTSAGSHLVRIPLTALEEQWGEAGFVRIHRSYLVALAHVVELRTAGGRHTVVLRGTDDEPVELAVSRRHGKDLRDVLLKRPHT